VRVTGRVLTQLKAAALGTELVINKNKINENKQKYNKFRARSGNHWADV
jgi:hypothetical protein